MPLGLGQLVQEVRPRVGLAREDGITSPADARARRCEPDRELDDVILAVRFERWVHGTALEGAGDRSFRADADIAMLESLRPRYKDCFRRRRGESRRRTR